ncbi:hypothetical protein AYI70_g4865 [Smittium culicis]|uniref:Uncharacterized protein n=1 Tax=Smittium culicis TaxID=133412 RepID=A0A1R1XXB5_9FUNG|nr:hypothetical protein AYI70_g8021 [Smittium culicis]OMJ14252.1 hypothetical protein AYI70_g8002 [Smittium culicis]OMJ19204.1 hypothetical protein AYI70_g4865 [Smittium culicis]
MNIKGSNTEEFADTTSFGVDVAGSISNSGDDKRLFHFSDSGIEPPPNSYAASYMRDSMKKSNFINIQNAPILEEGWNAPPNTPAVSSKLNSYVGTKNIDRKLESFSNVSNPVNSYSQDNVASASSHHDQKLAKQFGKNHEELNNSVKSSNSSDSTSFKKSNQVFSNDSSDVFDME